MHEEWKKGDLALSPRAHTRTRAFFVFFKYIINIIIYIMVFLGFQNSGLPFSRLWLPFCGLWVG